MQVRRTTISADRRVPRLALAALALALCAPLAVAQSLPWTDVRLLHSGSEPPLAYEATHRLARADGRLAALTKDGLATFVLRDGAWEAGPAVPLTDGVAAAWAGDRAVALTGMGLVLLDQSGDCVTLPELACPAGSRGALAAVPGTTELLVIVDGRAHLVHAADGTATRAEGVNLGDGAVYLAATDSAVYGFSDRGLGRWDHEAREFVQWTDAGGEPVDAAQKSLSAHPDGRWLYAGTAGDGLLAIDLRERTVHHTDPERLQTVADQHIFPVAVDTKRDVLYVPTWTHVVAVAPASDPTRWREIGYLNSMTDPALHTYRAVAAVAGLTWLPETDHLVFGGRWGIDVLSGPVSGPFVTEENFGEYEIAATAIPGEGAVYDRIRAERLRAIYVNAGRATPEAFERFAEAGINAVFYQIYFIEHGEFYEPLDVREHLREVAGWAEDAGLMLFATARPVGWSQFNHEAIRDYEYRRYVTRSGQVGRYEEQRDVPGYNRGEFPCHFDHGYWERSVGHQIAEFGRLAAEAPIAGFVLEMGDGFSGSNIRASSDACMCDDCWRRFLDHHEIEDPQARELEIDGWNRFHWLNDRDLWEDYLALAQNRLAALAGEYLQQARAQRGDLVATVALPETSGHYDDSWYYRGWIGGLGTPDLPALVCSQQTYGAPFSPTMAIDPGRRLREQGLHLLFVPGLATIWHTPEQLARRTARNLAHTPGTWYYHGNYWFGEHLAEDIYEPRTPGVEGSFAVPDYIEALSAVGAPGG